MFIMNADGSNLIPLPSVPGGDYDPAWSPDGKYIAFTSLRANGVPGIYVLNLEDNSITSLAESDGRSNSRASWSPDGLHLTYLGSDGRVWVMDADGSNRTA
jgi:Tol biopolymer transport system component